MEVSKIHLSPAEKELFCNAEIILTKNSIINKTILLLEEVQERLIDEKDQQDFFSVPPKISKGENYLGLPYVILDYPRKSVGPDLFFIRSMFWWGHFFSSTLQISGKYKDEYIEELSNSYDKLKINHYHIGINENPWNHHFEESNFKPIQQIDADKFKNLLQEQDHIKIAKKWPLTEWDTAHTKLYESWMYFFKLIT